MKVAVVTNQAPFIYGGAEFLADCLVQKLIEHGHEAEVIRFPFSWNPTRNILDSLMAVRLAELVNTDLAVCLKFPAYYIQHPNKRIWLLHQFRQAYDLYETEYNLFSNSEEDQNIRNSIIAADNQYLGECQGRIHTISPVVSNRLMKYNSIPSEVLYHPLMDAHLFTVGEFGDYIFCPSRVNQGKRQYLAVEAMRYVKTKVRLVLAGKGDSQTDESQIFELIQKYGLQDKVTYHNRFITQQEKADLFANCLAGLYIPYDEDSYGYVTLEAIHSGKAVISCTDSGGTYVIVKNGETGYLTAPDPKAIAEKMDMLYLDKKSAKRMGHNGFQLIDELEINWENVVRRLTE